MLIFYMQFQEFQTLYSIIIKNTFNNCFTNIQEINYVNFIIMYTFIIS